MFALSKWYIKHFYTYVGKDTFGNQYYTKKSTINNIEKERRFCVYSGANESSKVPAMWHAWLHYISDTIPDFIDSTLHTPNLTGTKTQKYQGGAPCDISANKYSSWKPGSNQNT